MTMLNDDVKLMLSADIKFATTMAKKLVMILV
jgi:hypothetical protein